MDERMRRVVLPKVGLNLLAAGAVLVGFSCGEGDITEPTASTLEVTTSTTGLEPDANGYTVQIDAEITQALGPSATMRTVDIAPGNHTVQLGSVAANCRVAGENPRLVNVSAGGTTTVTFEVTCLTTISSLQVSSITTGPSPDADGYGISVDGTDRGTLGQSDQVTLGGLAPGDHSVGLSGVTGNCQVEGDNPRSVAFTAGASATAAFEVACDAPPPNAGTLRLTITTTGADPDLDGYVFTVDGEAAQPSGVNASATLDNLTASTHTVRLSSIAENCSLEGANPRSATVLAGATADVSFTITCSATTGTIQVNVTTSGSAPDPDGYVARLDGGASEQPIATSGTVSFASVPAGDHTVALTDVTANCSVAEEASRSVIVAVGASSEVSFVVTCAERTGSVQVTAATSGASLDPDGYAVALDGGTAIAIARDGSYAFGGLTPGAHQIALAGVSTNCRAEGENPRDITVAAGATATIAFGVSCSLQLVFVSDRNNATFTEKIYVMNADGTNVTQLTEVGEDFHPAWSPDGSKIAFARNVGTLNSQLNIFIMNADGSGQSRLTTQPGQNPVWSPDGSKIAFLGADPYPARDFYVIGADGSGLTNLTNNPGFHDHMAWSPDGTRIAFVRGLESDLNGQRFINYEVFMMNADGSGQTRLTNDPQADFFPTWAPDGSMLAFERSFADGSAPPTGNIWVMRPDGSGQVNLTKFTEEGVTGSGPAWSPSGDKVAFTRSGPEFIPDIAVVNADGSGLLNLTNTTTLSEFGPTWSPDGSRIAFGGTVNNAVDISVMNPDGTNRTNLTNNSVNDLHWAWRP
jgi:Tol biopolymer transport system component